jgi:crossover junction endodeoxyribonuclease RuvC
MRILGIDPGSRLTGYGCIDRSGNQLIHVTHGTLRLSNTGGKAIIPLEDRLYSIFVGLSKIIQEFRPQVMAIEKVFFAKNAVSALKLGQARGAAILTGKIHNLEIVEYSPTEVKSVVTGYGQADKSQVFKMVQILTHQQTLEGGFDASDGLALAICHAYSARSQINSSPQKKLTLKSLSNQRRNKKSLSMAESVATKIPQEFSKKRNKKNS